jgi:DNA-dependent RNA polymerase
MRYGLNLNVTFNSQLRKESIGNLSCTAIYNRMSSYKYAIKGILNDCNVYVNFHYFYVTHYITSTSRVFTRQFFLSFQSNKFSLSFIRFLDQGPFTAESHQKMQEILQTVMPELPKAITSTSFESYQQHKRYLLITYIKSMLIPTVNLKHYPYNDSVLSQVTWIANYIKKPKNIYYVRMLILAAKSKHYDNLVYEKDATSSALQMISLIMRCKDISAKVNLIGDEYIDIYQQFSNEFNSSRVQQSQVLNTALIELFEKDLNQFLIMEKPLKPTTISQLIHLVIIAEDFNSAYAEIKDHITEEVSTRIKSMNFSVTNLYCEDPLLDNSDVVKSALRKLNSYLKLYCACIGIEDFFLSRNLFKDACMTYPYNAGASTRYDGFREYLVEQLIERGYDHFSESKLQIICKSLLNYFEHLRVKYLQRLDDFLFLCRSALSIKLKASEAVSIDMPDIQWDLHISKKKLTRSRISLSDKEVIHFSNLESVERDSQKMTTTFASIFIHGVDGSIVYSLIALLRKINTLCREKGIPQIFAVTNHDCFGFNLCYSYYLSIIIRELYMQLSNSDIINQLILDPKFNFIFKRSRIKVTNPYFIKH